MNAQIKPMKEGRGYELLSYSIYQKLVRDPRFERVEHDVRLDGVDGPRQIDVLLTAEIAGIVLRTLVECKDYTRKVSVGDVDAFHSKIQDVKGNKGVLIARSGFSSTALTKAKRVGIDLYRASESLSDRWALDLDFEVLVQELTPVSSVCSGTLHNTVNLELTQSDLQYVNGFDVVKIIDQKWKEGTLKVGPIEGQQEVSIPELQPPYILSGTNNSLADLKLLELKWYITLRVRNFRIRLSELRETQLLTDLVNGKFHLFISAQSIVDVLPVLRPIDRRAVEDFTGFIVEVRLQSDIDHKQTKYKMQKIGQS